MKKIVVFYSLDGNTKFLAEAIAKETNADILELQPEKEFRFGKLSKYLWGGKQVVMKKTPPLKPYSKNFADYDTVFIGTPVWVGTFAPVIRTFLTENKLTDKKIAFFASFGGSIGKTFMDFKSQLSGNEIIGEIGFLNAAKNQVTNIDAIKSWLASIIK